TLKPFSVITYIFILISLTTSCIPLKDIKYIQPDEKLKLNEHGMIVENRPQYYLHVYDQILIRIVTRSSEMLNMFYDFTTQQGPTGQTGKSVIIQDDGNIELPRVGKIHVEGLTLIEAREKIETEFYK